MFDCIMFDRIMFERYEMLSVACIIKQQIRSSY